MTQVEVQARRLLEFALHSLETGTTVERLEVAANIRAFLTGTEGMVNYGIGKATESQ